MTLFKLWIDLVPHYLTAMLSLILRRSPPCSTAAGFTLLEVMIAVAILAIGLTTLFGSQFQSVSLASLTKFNIRAPQLAQLKLAELTNQPSELFAGSGDFADEFSGYSWTLMVEEAGLDESTILGGIGENLQKLTLTISLGEDTYSYQVQSYTFQNLL